MTLPYLINEIAAERQRQIEVEGWSVDHDDQHADGSLAMAAAAYAHPLSKTAKWLWPPSWSLDWWKPKDRRRDLIRAAALIVAEIERLDRASAKGSKP